MISKKILGKAGYNTNLVAASMIVDGSSQYLSAAGISAPTTRGIISVWFKRNDFSSADQTIVSLNTSGPEEFALRFDSTTNQLRISDYDGAAFQLNIKTQALYRDTGWYHVVASFDTNVGTANDRCRIWVNGEEPALTYTTTYDSADSVNITNATAATQVGIGITGTTQHFDGYIAQCVYVRGESIQNGDHTIDSFGEAYTAGTNGSIWVPKADADVEALADPAGSFALTSGIAAGTDASGNGNNFTPTGSPVSSTNTPSLVYPTINPLESTQRFAGTTLSSGNLAFGPATSARATATHWLSGAETGKFAFNVTPDNTGSFTKAIGITRNDGYGADYNTTTQRGVTLQTDGTSTDVYEDGVAQSASVASAFNGPNTIQCVLDFDNDQVSWYEGASLLITYSYTFDPAYFYAPWAYQNGGTGNNTFAFSGITMQSAGAKEISSANLTAPTYQGADWFNALLYTGDGTASRNITGMGGQFDLFWFKARTTANRHVLVDTVREADTANAGAVLYSDGTDAEVNEGEFDGSIADGFTVSAGASNRLNYAPAGEMVVWGWKAGGAGTTNNDGTITSTVSAASTGHLSVGTYTGTGAAATIGHGLGGAPEIIIVKDRDTARSWPVYEAIVNGETHVSYLDLTNAAASAPNHWNNTAPTSTVFSVGTSLETNDTGSMVFYAFRSIAGVCKVGTYIGNGSADGPYVYCGFKPRWLLVKRIAGAENWVIRDTARSTYNATGNAPALFTDTSGTETTVDDIDFLADGFKVRDTGSATNFSTGEFLYIAMADVAGGGILPPIPGR